MSNEEVGPRTLPTWQSKSNRYIQYIMCINTWEGTWPHVAASSLIWILATYQTQLVQGECKLLAGDRHQFGWLEKPYTAGTLDAQAGRCLKHVFQNQWTMVHWYLPKKHLQGIGIIERYCLGLPTRKTYTTIFIYIYTYIYNIII